jgi:signal transduction histidine kinase
VEFRIRTNAGLYRRLEAAMSSLRDPTASNVVLICRDTARREAELVEQSLSKDRFIAMLSHELRTPLSPISLGVEELREDERFIEARPTLADEPGASTVIY